MAGHHQRTSRTIAKIIVSASCMVDKVRPTSPTATLKTKQLPLQFVILQQRTSPTVQHRQQRAVNLRLVQNLLIDRRRLIRNPMHVECLTDPNATISVAIDGSKSVILQDAGEFLDSLMRIERRNELTQQVQNGDAAQIEMRNPQRHRIRRATARIAERNVIASPVKWPLSNRVLARRQNLQADKIFDIGPKLPHVLCLRTV